MESAMIASNRDIGRADGKNDEREGGKKANISLSKRKERKEIKSEARK